MENTFVVNNEPITIKITIEVIPGNKKEEVEPIKSNPPITLIPQVMVDQQYVSPLKSKDEEIVSPLPVEPIVVPVATPEKKKRAYTKKIKEVVPAETPKGDEPDVKPPPVVTEAPRAGAPTAPTPNKVVANLAKMIRFYCKASNIEPSTVTKKYLIDHGAADIIEGSTDEDVEEAFKEVVKRNDPV